MRRTIRKTLAVLAAVIMLSQAHIVGAAEIKVLSTTAMKTTLDILAPQFERTTGHKIVASYEPAARIAKRIADGEANDVAIITGPGIDTLIKQGKIVAASRANIARSVAGIAVQKGAPIPNISSVENFKQALLAAKSIAISSGQSGAHLAKVFDQLGITEALKPKIIIGKGGDEDFIGYYLVRGEAEIGIHQMPALMAVPGINIVGPLPIEIQSITVFAAGLSTGATDADAGKALINFLTMPAAIAVMKSKGLEPG
jgi:molybdate transport system substrate-binding protein